MSNLAYDDSAVSELIGYVYTIAVSILILCGGGDEVAHSKDQEEMITVIFV